MRILQILILVVLQCYCDIQTLDLSYNNNFENNQISNSRVIQGSLLIYNALVDNSTIYSQNSISNTKIDGLSLIKQSSINLINDSTLTESNIYLSSSITESKIDRKSLILQNNILMKDTHMNASLIQSNVKITQTNIQSSMILQSYIELNNDSRVNNGSSFTFNNLIENAHIENSILSQSELQVNNSILNNVQITSNNNIGSNQGYLELDNAIVVQGLNDIVKSNLRNSKLITNTSISDTTIRDSVLNLCSNYIHHSKVSQLNLQKNCSMKNSTISNGAIFYQGMTKFN